MPYLETKHSNIYYEIIGSGPPVIFISGMASDHNSWGHQILHFKKSFRIITLDNRGCGKSEGNIKDTTIDDMVSDVDALLKAINVDRAHIIGFSMGGMIALEYASRNPDKVASLVLSSLTTIQPDRVFESFADSLTAHMSQQDCSVSFFQLLSSYLFSSDFLRSRRFEAMSDWMAENSIEYNKETISMQLRAIRNWVSLRSWEKGCRCPCLIIQGAADRLIPLDDSVETLVGRLPYAKRKVIKDAGHAVNIEKADEFNKVVHEFLISQTASAAAIDKKNYSCID